MPENKIQESKKAPAKKEIRKKRIFVLDTNVLLHDSDSITAFKGVVVGIPFIVLEELDTFKKERGEKGLHARKVIRALDELRSRGSLHEGVEINNGTHSIVKVLPTPKIIDDYLCTDVNDDLILQTVENLNSEGYKTTFVTKDINARVKADALGLETEDYTKGTITQDRFYKGWVSIPMPSGDLKAITANKIPELLGDKKLSSNQFVILESENNPENSRLFRFVGGEVFKEVNPHLFPGQFQAKNIQQLMALDLLMDDEIKLVFLLGPAGTGKTFLTLLSGLSKVITSHTYKKLLVSRPIVALGADLGYLPGDMQEKLFHWMQPVHDNLEFIFNGIRNNELSDKNAKDRRHDKRHPEKKHPEKKRSEKSAMPEVERLKQKGLLSLDAITYMRGRSIPYQFMFIDEVQNLTPHEVKTIVTRAGEGTKIVLAGDPYQIDSPYLDFTSNGLTVTSDKFKNQSLSGTVYLSKSERSELAKVAAGIL